jgi:hypothetical protein
LQAKGLGFRGEQSSLRTYLPSFGHEIGVGAVELSDDPDTQVAQTVGMMLGYSDQDSGEPGVQYDALNAARLDDPITGNFYDVKRKIRFVPDDVTAEPFTSFARGNDIVETLVRPADIRIMNDPQGDCDDFAMTIRARMLALGIPCDFVTVAVDPQDPGRFSHVYAVADCNRGACGPRYSGRVPLDASHGDYPGWECPNPYGKRSQWPGVSLWKIAAGVALAGLAIWWLRS